MGRSDKDMKLLNLASNNSFWRGIDYHHENRIIAWKELADNCYQGKVRGSGSAVYDIVSTMMEIFD